ncbi:putative sigma-adaptin 3, putative,adaptor complex AP-3 small subunit [Trypanosoma grayi]|uniref:putative sigma-adaptin 3, putative,adaptor complex AP-3 small subunit n=1 Tax=Trypanosoma grayi TaxID=71804 RepID=UPI0004F3FADC|nr:putative sigma-adaptin 3, putative,adaptor complex AP-3 small subunit [Trypanosoma grayi]KEG12576.1 putative sigma-adaptin 3, putative,adaptor complex AP-3 small subunit [Trypanosoma grayi]
MTSGSVAAAPKGDLPLTVEELVTSYQRIQCRNEELCAFIEALRVECNSLADTSPNAAHALRDLLPIVADAKPCADTAAAAAARPKATKARGSSGGVLEGVVVKSAKARASPQPPAEDTTKSLFLRFVEEAKRDYKEECNVLRLKLLAMRNAQQLLAQARQKVRAQEERCTAYAASLNECRYELTKSRSQCSFLLSVFGNNTKNSPATEGEGFAQCSDCAEPDHSSAAVAPTGSVEAEAGTSLKSLTARVVRTEAELQESHEAVRGLEATVETLTYDNAQLKKRADVLAKERDELKLQTMQLEGQLQRVLSLMHENREAHITESQAALGGVVSQRQVEMEQRLQQLQSENRSLQSTLLQFQRQINDSELRAEDVCTASDEEMRALKGEVAHLRANLHEERLALQQTRDEWRRAAANWEQLDKVHQTVIQHMSVQLLRATFARIVASCRRDKLEAKTVTPAVLPCEGAAAPAIDETSLTVSTNAPIGMEEVVAQETTGVEMREVTPAATNDAVGTDCVNEIRARLEALESTHRKSLRHWQQVNQELRAALSASEEELKRKEELIKQLQRAQDSSHTTTVAARQLGGRSDKCEVGSDVATPPTQQDDVEQIKMWNTGNAENETLMRRVNELQKSKSSLDALVEDYKKRCAALEQGIAHHADTLQHTLVQAAVSTAGGHVRNGSGVGDGSSMEAGQLRSFQRMLHSALQENIVLSARLKELETR